MSCATRECNTFVNKQETVEVDNRKSQVWQERKGWPLEGDLEMLEGKVCRRAGPTQQQRKSVLKATPWPAQALWLRVWWLCDEPGTERLPQAPLSPRGEGQSRGRRAVAKPPGGFSPPFTGSHHPRNRPQMRGGEGLGNGKNCRYKSTRQNCAGGWGQQPPEAALVSVPLARGNGLPWPQPRPSPILRCRCESLVPKKVTVLSIEKSSPAGGIERPRTGAGVVLPN